MKNFRKRFAKMSQTELEEYIASTYVYGGAIELAKFMLAQKKVDSAHKQNLDIVKKQSRLLILSTILTVVAMLASVILGYRLQEMRKYSQKPMSSEQSIQLNKPPKDTKHSKP